MHDEWIAKLAEIGEAMNALVKSADATIGYELMSDSLSWSDEFPVDGPTLGEDCLRLILNYRTSLIINEPKPEFLPYWLAAKKEFPKWPGFDPERCKPDEALAAFHRKRCSEGLFSLNLADIVFRLQQEFEGMVPWKMIEKHVDQNDPRDITAGELYDLTCRCVRLAGKKVPVDAWDRVRRSVSEGLGVAPELVTKESWWAAGLHAG